MVNTVNSNIIGSNFYQLLLNVFENMEGDVDLSGMIRDPQEVRVGTEEFSNIVNNNLGYVENNIIANAASGGNSISGNHGEAEITTGNANISINVLNVVNTNIVGSNCLLLIINVFDDWEGDLIFPGKQVMIGLANEEIPVLENEEAVEDDEESEGTENSGAVSYNQDNQALIENEININANTGGNAIEDAEGDADIRTGNANTKTNVLNIANSNISVKKWMWLTVNTFNNNSWKGNIFSLPEGYTVTGDGAQVNISSFDPTAADNSGNPEDGTENFSGEDGALSGSSNINSGNEAGIKNNIDVNADTGGNSIYGGDGANISVDTGDANISANIFNLANSNITADNWIFGMVNIFGEWRGDVAFGRPDLWIGEIVETSPNPAQPGSLATYTLSYFNNGDADASKVVITDDYDENYLSVVDPGLGDTSAPGQIQWNIGSVPAGGSSSVSYSAAINSEMPAGRTYISNTASIGSFEDDGNTEDNTETLSVTVDVSPPSSAGPSYPVFYQKKLPDLNITKTNDAGEFVYLGEEINYKIVLTNDGKGSAYDVIVYDALTYEDSADFVKTNSWNLGEVFPGEEVVIEYTVAINGGSLPGIYTNTAFADGFDGNNNLIYSAEASSAVEVREEETISEEEPEEILPEETLPLEEEILPEEIKEKVETIPSVEKVKSVDHGEKINLIPLIPEVKAAMDVSENDSDKPEEKNSEGSEEETGIFSQWWSLWLVIIIILIIAGGAWYLKKEGEKGNRN